MSDIASINRQLAAKTSSFLLDCLYIGCEVAADVLERNRKLDRGSRSPMDAGEQLRMRCGFTAAGLVIDALEAEGRRQRLGLQAAFSVNVLSELERSAQHFAQYARALERQGDLFLLNFYNKLSARLQRYYASQDRPKVLRPGEALDDDDADDDDDGLPEPRLRGEPTAQRGYESIARKTGQYEQIRQGIKDHIATNAEFERAAARSESRAAVMEADPPPEELPDEKLPDEMMIELPEAPEAAPAADQEPVAEGMIDGELPKDHVDEIFNDRKLTKPLVEWYREMHDWFNSSGQGPPPKPPPGIREVARANRKGNPQTNLLLDFEEHWQEPK